MGTTKNKDALVFSLRLTVDERLQLEKDVGGIGLYLLMVWLLSRFGISL